MEGNTFQIKKTSNFSNILVYALVILGMGLLVYLGVNVFKNLDNLNGKSAFSVSVLEGNSEVYLNDEYLGNTPYESKEIKSGENKIRIKNSTSIYDVVINFMPNSEIVLNRDLGISNVFSSGQNFWIEKADLGTVLSVVSDPGTAKVFIDNTEVGTTPYSSGDLSDGEYDLRVEKAGYESQTARIKIQKGFKLNVVLKMFPLPVPPTVNLLEGSSNLYDIYSTEASVSANAPEWTKAVLYWNRTRGINLSGTGLNKEPVFDYFVDYSGKVYDKDGTDVTGNSEFALTAKGAYLRRLSDGPGLSEAAKSVLQAVSSISGKKAVIKETGTGWLNLRTVPGLNGEVIQKVNVGETFAVVEEQVGWVKIKVSDTVSGWVSSTYVTIQE